MPSTSSELKNQIVRAGAGAGKTTALTAQVLQVAEKFLDEEGRIPSVVVTTFTRKATQELNERLMAKACIHENPELLAFVTSKSHLHISTIHGVLSQFLSRHGYRIGLDPNYLLMSEKETQFATRKVLRELLFESEDFVELLQRYEFRRLQKILEAYLSAKMSIANFRPHSKETLKQLMKTKIAQLAKRLDSAAASVLAEAENEKWRLFADKMQEVSQVLQKKEYREARQDVLGRIAGLKKPVFNSKKPPVSEEVAEQLAEAWRQVKALAAIKKEESHWNPDLWPDFLREFASFEKLAEIFFQKMQSQKIESGQMRMADLEELSLDLIRRFPDAAEAFAKEWDYWLIDEYQDTSPIQVEILQALIGDRKHFIVGDPQQSIYLFRGARSEVFAKKEEEILEQNGERQFLRKNYRSDPGLLLFFNDFFQKYGRQFEPMQPRNEPEGEKKTVARFAILPKEEGEKTSELAAVSEHLTSLFTTGVRPDEIAILGRTNSALEKLARGLSDHGYPVHVHAASGFYQRREIRDALSLLKFFVNPNDDLNILTLLRSPWFRVQDEELVKEFQNRESSIWQGLIERRESFKENRPISHLFRLSEEAREWGVGYVFEKALNETYFLQSSQKIDSTGRREANIWKLIERLKEAEKKPGFNLIEFISDGVKDLSDLEFQSDSDAVAAVEPNRINLMTVHGSKGLQFRHVLLPDLQKRPLFSKKSEFMVDEETGLWSLPIFSAEESTFLHSIASSHLVEKMRDKEILEQERLLYVAMTRAKESVFLSWSEPAEKLSLAEKIKFFESGESEFYRYEVERGPWEIKKYQGPEVVKKLDLKPLKLDSTVEGRRLSVSQILQDESAKANLGGDLFTKVEKAGDGVLIHRLLENLRYRPDLNIESLAGEWFPKKKDDVLRGVEYLRSLSSPPMNELLAEGHVEWGFLARFGQATVEGQIDLWGTVDETLWVVDYKTGSTAFLEKAFLQLAFYGEALAKKGKFKKIKLAVLFPFQEKAFVEDYEKFASQIAKKVTSL